MDARNDAPRLVRALPDVTTQEDVNPANTSLSPLYFFDPDAGLDGVISYSITNSNALLVTPTITNGVLALNLGANRSGSATITIQASDRSGQSVSDTFILTVTSVDDAPTTVSDSYSVPRGTTFSANDARGTNTNLGDNGVLANDSDPEGTVMTAEVVRGPANGQLTFRTDGTFTYVHNGSQISTDSFTYRALDAARNASVETTVNITITAATCSIASEPTSGRWRECGTGRRDVNADGFITPVDALIIINFLNVNRGGRSVVGLPAPPPYRDVDGNNFIAPLDALLVINYLNSRRSSGVAVKVKVNPMQSRTYRCSWLRLTLDAAPSRRALELECCHWVNRSSTASATADRGRGLLRRSRGRGLGTGRHELDWRRRVEQRGSS